MTLFDKKKWRWGERKKRKKIKRNVWQDRPGPKKVRRSEIKNRALQIGFVGLAKEKEDTEKEKGASQVNP